MSELLPVGIHPGIPRAVYFADPAINQSSLKEFENSCAHFEYRQRNPKPQTKDMHLGDVTHASVVEPARFEKEYVCARKFDHRKSAERAEEAAFFAANEGKEIIDGKEWETVTAMRDSVWRYPQAADLLKGNGVNEVTIIWIDPVTGLRCKGRIDRLRFLDSGWTVVLDLKTAKDASPKGFAKQIANLNYHMQAAFYIDGLNAIAKGNRRFLFLAVEKTPPYVPALYDLSDDAINEGRMKYRHHLRLYQECTKTGYWPGYTQTVEPITIPKWSFEMEAETEDEAEVEAA